MLQADPHLDAPGGHCAGPTTAQGGPEVAVAAHREARWILGGLRERFSLGLLH
jgi:hypothetical protein